MSRELVAGVCLRGLPINESRHSVGEPLAAFIEDVCQAGDSMMSGVRARSFLNDSTAESFSWRHMSLRGRLIGMEETCLRGGVEGFKCQTDGYCMAGADSKNMEAMA